MFWKIISRAAPKLDGFAPAKIVQDLPEREENPISSLPNKAILINAFAEIKDADDKTRISQVLNDPSIDSVSLNDAFLQALWAVLDGDSRAVIRKHFGK